MTNQEWEKLEAAVSSMTSEEMQRLLGLLMSSSAQAHSVGGSVDNFMQQLQEVAFDAPALPADFSRADIYSDHD